MDDSIDEVLNRAIDRRSVREVGAVTEPRSYGVDSLPAASGATRPYRFGNHPIRMHELEKEFGSCTLEYLFADREDAFTVARTLDVPRSAGRVRRRR